MTSTTGQRILNYLSSQPHLKLKKESNGQWRANSPFREGSDSYSFTLTIDETGEKGAWTDYAARDGAGDSGSLYDLAERLGIEKAPKNIIDSVVIGSSKRAYSGLDDYAKEHGVSGNVFRAAGWSDTTMYQGRPALPFSTATGIRYRFIDGKKPTYKHQYGYKPTWYGLSRAMDLSQHMDDTIVICNGEASTVVAQYYGVAACAVTSGEKSRFSDEILASLKSAGAKNIIVAYDCDPKGRSASKKITGQLNSMGFNARAIDFGRGDGYDVADFCKEYTTSAPIEILELDDKTLQTGNILIEETPDDEGNARCTLFLHNNKFLYTNEMGWLYYTGTHWTTDTAEAMVGIAVLDTLKKRRIEAVKNGYEMLARRTQGSAANMGNAMAIIKKLVTVSIDSFTAAKDELNCKNGVVNLRTKEIKPHSYKQRFLYCVQTEYNPEADYSDWHTWVYNTVTPIELHDSIDAEETDKYVELAKWLQRAIGYTLTGYTKENCLFYIQGETRAGKGVFLQTIATLMGKPLAQTVDFNMFMAQKTPDSQNFALAPLKPSRMIIASESGDKMGLDEKMIKAMTGDDAIRCAFKRKDAFEYVPEFKMWMASNFPVSGNANDNAFWGRIRAITFPNSYFGKEDFNLKEKMSREENLEAVLNWAVDGAAEWFVLSDKNGLGIPNMMSKTVEQSRNESDSVWQFIEDRCTLQKDADTPVSRMMMEYKSWCNDNGFHPLGARRFSSSLKKRFNLSTITARIGGKPSRCWRGIMINDDL